MKLIFNMAVAGESVSYNNTPSLSSQRLPLFLSTAGHFITGAEYYTERQGLENNFLLMYTIGGRGLLKYRGAEHSLLPGQAVIIDCYEYQYYARASDVPWEFKWVHIQGMAAGEYEQRINGGSLNIIQLNEGCRTEAALDGVLALLRDREDFLSDVKICGKLIEILTEMATARVRPTAAGGYQRHKADMESALAYIRGNYGQCIGIDDIIERTHISKYYFLRLFKAYTGLGLYEYLNNYRIDMAKEQLKASGETVGGIALSVGFNDVNCFIRYFKKVTGVTPDLFRRYYLY